LPTPVSARETSEIDFCQVDVNRDTESSGAGRHRWWPNGSDVETLVLKHVRHRNSLMVPSDHDGDDRRITTRRGDTRVAEPLAEERRAVSQLHATVRLIGHDRKAGLDGSRHGRRRRG
jgi:hypothetical protein